MSKSAVKHSTVSDGKKTKTFSSVNSAAKEYGISNCAITNALKKGNKSITRRSDKKILYLGEPKAQESALSLQIDFSSLPMDEEWFDKFKIIVSSIDDLCRSIANKLFADEDIKFDWKKKELIYNEESISFIEIISIICRVMFVINREHFLTNMKDNFPVGVKATTNHAKLLKLIVCLRKNERTFHVDIFNKIKKYK